MRKYFFLVLLLTVAAVRPAQALSDKIYKDLETFSRIIEIVDDQYVSPADEHALIQGAIRGMLLTLDPHTIYLPADQYRDFKSDTTGKFGGVGIEITFKDGFLTVVSPLEDSPAYSAGIRSGDRIIKIDGVSTKGMAMNDAVHHMRGPKGKPVILTVMREGNVEPLDVTVIRGIIKIQSVKSESLPGGYGFVRITSFQENTGASMRKALDNLSAQAGGKLKGIALDLRDDPGGLLSEAIAVADLFIEKGPIVSTRGRDRQVEMTNAAPGSPYEKLPLVVLVNHGSASASEIVAGALQDTRRAKIIGMQSFGKGSVQTVIELAEKAALKITIAKYYTPKGRSIDGKGITPDVIIGPEQLKKEKPGKNSKSSSDLMAYQRARAIEILKKL